MLVPSRLHSNLHQRKMHHTRDDTHLRTAHITGPTDVLVSKDICMASSYLRASINASEESSEITLGGELKRSSRKNQTYDDRENRGMKCA